MVELKNANVFDYIRFVGSTLILLFSAVITSYAIVEKKTGFFDAVPGWAALILFVVDLFILGIVEGLQIALVELKRQHPDTYRHTHPAAYRLGQIASKGDNVERFLMGRQVFVVVLVFFAAKLTTILLEEGEHFLIPAPLWFRRVFLETGILACVVVVIIAQLMPQIVAAKYPVHFLQIFIMRPAYYTCVFVETTGITHVCWLLSAALGYVMGMSGDAEFDNEEEEGKYGTTSPKIIENTVASIISNEDESSGDNKANGIAAEQRNKFIRTVETLNKELDPAALLIMQRYLDNHPEMFQSFPSVVGGRVYASPQAISQQLQADGQQPPAFLRPINDPGHIPPHIVATDLMALNRSLLLEVEYLRRLTSHFNRTKM